jgi:purine-binding chemotaxis protein CheW
MELNQNDLLDKLREQFFSDPDDQIGQIEILASTLPEDFYGSLDVMMRAAHNLKGAAQLAGVGEFGELVHEVETIFQEMQARKFTDEDIQNSKMYVRRLGTLIRNRFESLKSGDKSNDHKEAATWEVTIQSLRMMCSTSEPAQKPSAPVPDASSKPADSFDDWGLSLTPGPEAPAPVAAPAPSVETLPAVAPPQAASSETDFSKGWVIFDDAPADTQTTKSGTDAVEKKTSTSAPQIPPNPVTPTRVATSMDAAAVTMHQKVNELIKESQKDADHGDTYLMCHQGKTSYALPVRFVQEIMPNRPLKPLPIKRKKVAGVISFRGQVMPVIDIFGHKPGASAQEETGGCIIVCQIGRKLFGFRIDEVSSVIDVKDEQLQVMHTKLEQDGPRLVSHLAHIDGKPISFLDLSGVVTP